MNERIQELIKQSKMSLWEPPDPTSLVSQVTHPGNYAIFSDWFLEKFAELIVQECMSIIKQGEGLGEEDDFDKGFQAGIAMAYNRVRTQMGIEE